MDKISIDDVLSIIKGKRTNFSRQPYSLWKHFPGHDLRPEDSVKAHMQFQELVKSDLIKISPHSKYALVDFGVEFNPSEFNKETGSYITKKYPIHTIKDWEKIEEFDPQTGELGKQIELVRKLSKELQNTPSMMTVFFPTMIARKLVLDDKLIEHFNDDKELVKDRLQVLTNVMTEFSKICIEAGATGLFLATQETDLSDGWNFEDWSKIALPFDRQVIDKLRTKAEFQLLHLHGEKIFFKDVLKKIKIDAINFHAFLDFPKFFSDPKMQQIYQGGLLGGLEDNFLQKVASEPITDTAAMKNLIDSFEPISSRIIVAPNCVLPQSLTNEELENIITKLRA